MLPGENAGQGERVGHGGEPHRRVAEPGARTKKGIKEPVVPAGARRSGSLGELPEEAEGGEGALGRGIAAYVSRLGADRVRGEREADRRDAGERRRGPAVGREPGLGAAPLPEEGEGALLDGVEEGLAPRRRGPRDGGGRRGTARKDDRARQGEEGAGAGSVGRQGARHARDREGGR